MNTRIFLAVSILGLSQLANTALAGGRSSSDPNLMDRLLDKTSSQGLHEAEIIHAADNMQAGPACAVTIPGQSNALVVSRADHAAALENKFSLRRTLQQIIDTSGSATTTQEQLFASMSASFENPDGTLALFHSNNGVDMPVDPRQPELDFVTNNIDNVINTPTDIDPGNTIHVLDEMAPTGVFNRIDLAAADGSHCGEYRIVYHWLEGSFAQLGGFEAGSLKFFMIFEAQYPNPSPGQGLAGCLPLAEFWESLNAINDSDQLVTELENFFFTGMTWNGTFLPPVVDFGHYTQQTGQVRVNMFVNHGGLDTPNNRQIWQLREFRTAIAPGGDAIFDVDTVKVNPLVELYADTLPPELDHLPAGFAADFQSDFVDQVVAGLVAPEMANLTSQTDIVNSIKMTDLPEYNEFQSNSSGRGEIPSDSASRSAEVLIRDAIAVKLAELQLPAGITPDHVLARATANSCSGCHNTAAALEIAPGIDWPGTFPNTRFVHIHEHGGLSNTLTDHFLPGRADVLTDFICNPPAPVCSSDSDGDLVCDDVDNCIDHANADQTDTDGDGHGNRCDGDFDQSCGVNFADLVQFKMNFFGTDPEFDLDNSGPPVNFGDLVIFKQLFFSVPGPSPAGSLCNP